MNNMNIAQNDFIKFNEALVSENFNRAQCIIGNVDNKSMFIKKFCSKYSLELLMNALPKFTRGVRLSLEKLVNEFDSMYKVNFNEKSTMVKTVVIKNEKVVNFNIDTMEIGQKITLSNSINKRINQEKHLATPTCFYKQGEVSASKIKKSKKIVIEVPEKFKQKENNSSSMVWDIQKSREIQAKYAIR